MPVHLISELAPHFEVKVIEDSIADMVSCGHATQITTLELVYPRFIHAEFMTHRVFSRNASSSRAIPTKKLLEIVRDKPCVPIHWGKNQSGMQAHEELEDSPSDDPCLFGQSPRRIAKSIWLNAAHDAAKAAAGLMQIGAHKQIVNRVLEPFTPIRVVVTSTDWANFFALRRHRDAQPEIRHLADLMDRAMKMSKPRTLKRGQWHLPYILPEERDQPDTLLTKLSAARCARVSYRTHDGHPPDAAEDLALYDRLMGAAPVHASPTEHQATPDWLHTGPDKKTCFATPTLHGNFRGWRQHRKLIMGECVRDV